MGGNATVTGTGMGRDGMVRRCCVYVLCVCVVLTDVLLYCFGELMYCCLDYLVCFVVCPSWCGWLVTLCIHVTYVQCIVYNALYNAYLGHVGGDEIVRANLCCFVCVFVVLCVSLCFCDAWCCIGVYYYLFFCCVAVNFGFT